MEVRKLKINEHQNTRELWELVFKEDTNSFLDYYYTQKTSENEIYVIEEETKIRGMLQLNPYMLRMGGQECQGHYIVAVATHPEYRKQGIMRKLLHASLREMYERKEAFTFLMPAAEAIYLPFDFRFVYNQRQGRVVAKPNHTATTASLKLRQAKEADCEGVAEFAMQYLRDKDVYVKRDAAYYRCLIKELKSENGGIMLIEQAGKLIGCYLYTNASQYIIREPLFDKRQEIGLAEVIGSLSDAQESTNQEKELKCLAYEGDMTEVEEKPMIMARILHPEIVLREIKVNCEVQINVAIQDPIISENNRVLRLAAKAGEYLSVCESAQEPDVTLGIGELTSILFGYEKNEKLAMIVPLDKIFLNEVV